jgi:hypothetical protein
MAMMVVALGACAAQTSQPSNAGAATTSQSADGSVPIPASSPLAKVQLGMRKTQVTSVLGAPNDENSYPTGKMWIPFYFGDDARRTSWYYKGIGRVVFADGNVFGGGGGYVIRLDYDPSETGLMR